MYKELEIDSVRDEFRNVMSDELTLFYDATGVLSEIARDYGEEDYFSIAESLSEFTPAEFKFLLFGFGLDLDSIIGGDVPRFHKLDPAQEGFKSRLVELWLSSEGVNTADFNLSQKDKVTRVVSDLVSTPAIERAIKRSPVLVYGRQKTLSGRWLVFVSTMQ